MCSHSKGGSRGLKRDADQYPRDKLRERQISLGTEVYKLAWNYQEILLGMTSE